MAEHADPAAKLQRVDALKALRSVFDSHYDEVRKLFHPTATEFTAQMVRGAKLHKDVFDGTPETVAERAAFALYGVMYNQATRWMGLVTRDRRLMEVEAVAVWLEAASNAMLSMFASPRSQFGTQQFAKLLNWLIFGTGPQFIGELPRGPVFQTLPLAQCYVAENELGEVDTLYRLFKLPARQAVARWQATAGAKIRKKAEDPKKADEDVEILHVIEPRENVDASKLDTLNKPYRERFVALDDKNLLAESGFDEKPFVCPRMSPKPGEVYGRGRGVVALADAKMLQRSMKATIRAAEKRTDPPLQVADDGVISPLRMAPSGITVVRAELMQFAGGGIRPVETGADPGVGEDFNEAVRSRMRMIFWLDILLAFADRLERDPRMAATVGLKLDAEMLRFLGVIVGWLQTDDLGPMVERCFPIMMRQGMIEMVAGPVPPELAEAELEVEYVSPIAKAQQLESVRGWAETMDLLASWRAAHPEVDDNFNGDFIARHIAQNRSVPAPGLNARAAVAEIRTARTQAAEEAETTRQAMEGAPAAAKVMGAMAQMQAANGNAGEAA